jgi:glycosyltransferase involved in cell wall biosynthesis
MTLDFAPEQPVAVSVVVATHNRVPLLQKTLDALLAQQTPADLNWEILIVDNASTDGTRIAVRMMAIKARVPVRCISEPVLGKSRALNTGIAAARGGVIAFTDDDVSPTTDWVATAAIALDTWGADGAGGRILPEWEAEPPAWLHENRRLRQYLALMAHDAPAMLPDSGKNCWVWGANMVFKRSVLQALGGFDIRLGPIGRRRYCEEDADMVQRVLDSGRRVVYDPALTVYHRVPKTRLQRSYFRRLVWDMGEGHGLAAAPFSGPSILGAPRWRFRQAARLLARSALRTVARRPEAFDSTLDGLGELGMLWGYFKRSLGERQRHRARKRELSKARAAR